MANFSVWIFEAIFKAYQLSFLSETDNNQSQCLKIAQNVSFCRLTSTEAEVRRGAAKEWCLWEMGTSKLIPDEDLMAKADNLDFAAAFSRIECHYFINNIFFEDNFILKNVDKLKDIPIDIVQGRYDVVCAAVSAWELNQAAPHSNLVMVPDAGHSSGELGIAKELVGFMNKYKWEICILKCK